MSFTPDRRFIVSGLLATPLVALPSAGFANANEPILGDVVLGDPEAPVTVIEYASLTCPHCASFHKTTWPKLKEAYVDTGKIRFIMREVYFDKYGLWASMAARCGGEKGFYPMVDAYLNNQSTWTRADNPGAEIQKIARRSGLGEERLRACMSDQDYAKTLIESYQTNAEADGVRATPSFIVNGELHSNMNFDEFAALLDEALGS
ncbi:MAG: DsbA family protein [Pseudomonadota bacterium]